MSAWSSVTGSLQFFESEIQQGELVPAKLLMGPDGIQKVQIQKLKGSTLGEMIYLYDVSSFLKKGNSFEADVKVIFINVPESKSVVHKLAGEELVISFPDITIKPTDAPPSFVYEEFSIPSRPKIILWSTILLILLVGSIYGRKVVHKVKAKKALKIKRATFKNEILAATDYDGVVTIWKKRSDYLKEFPHVEDSFRKLESVLFKYQFKPTQSEVEKKIVIEAYQKFCSDIMGGFNGV